MRRCALPLLILLAACDSPSLAFMDVPAQRIEVDGSLYSVRIKDERAESFRISRELLPRESVVLDRAGRAMEQASGCAIKKMDGDQAIQRAKLRC